ncbi:hypothetical protein AVEN_138078-1 [Araneus ventricosus]|uniref:Uncharacterized protein n=1 Tax=Araneus ventricosus TaxID=182803 RepID=A0A4Y2J1A7_ARAVE|nr:hypothetical protein AVEN_138078-1 [Araneus ventricosus]
MPNFTHPASLILSIYSFRIGPHAEFYPSRIINSIKDPHVWGLVHAKSDIVSHTSSLWCGGAMVLWVNGVLELRVLNLWTLVLLGESGIVNTVAQQIGIVGKNVTLQIQLHSRLVLLEKL